MATENSDDEFEKISQANHNKIISKMENVSNHHQFPVCLRKSVKSVVRFSVFIDHNQ